MRTVPILLGLCACLGAQVQDLATTDDGAQLYFATPYRLTGTNQADYLKIFRYGPSGIWFIGSDFELYRQLDLVVLQPEPYHDTNFYMAERPQVSADGSVVAYTASRNCFGGSHCIGYSLHQGFLAGSPDRSPGGGRITLSPDGRYALLFVTESLYPGPNPALVDLTANSTANLAAYGTVIGDGLQALAAGGVALLRDAQGALLWSSGGIRRLQLAGTPNQARLSADGATVVYELAEAGGTWRLRSYDVAGAQDRLLASAKAPAGTPVNPGSTFSLFQPVVTRDGKLVGYISNNQVQVQPTDGSAVLGLTNEPEGIVRQTISGSGNVVFAATASGRILRIDLPGGTVSQLSAAVPHLEVAGGAVAPGSRLDISVSNAPAGSVPVLNVPGGAPAPVIAQSGALTTFQVPWEAAAGSTLKLSVPGNPSVFEEAQDLYVYPSQPAFYSAPTPQNVYPPYVLAAHEDFRALVTEASPAREGEIVHLYATGLGAVSPPVATGAVTPNGIYTAQAPLNCTFGFQAATVLFAGLAPGTVGVNQIDVRVPGGISGRQLVLCGGAEGQMPVVARRAARHR
jgi:uncharacterized protein (TIGR03437 family)